MLEPTTPAPKLSKSEYAAALKALRVELINLQYDIAHSGASVVISINGDDRLSVLDLTNQLSEWMDTRYLPVRAFGLPSPRDQEHPWQWRYWEALPGAGQMAMFSGTAMPRAVRAAFAGRIDDEGFAAMVSESVEFEATLAEGGLTMIKLWLHLPADEARARLDPDTGAEPEVLAQLDERDRLLVRRRDTLDPIVERFIRATSGPHREWHVIEAGKRKQRDLTAARIVRDGLVAALEADAAPTPDVDGGHSPAAAASTAFALAQRAPSGPARLAEVDLSASIDYADYTVQLEQLQARLHNVWTMAVELKMSAVLAFEGWDAAGKGGVIRRLHRPLRAGTYLVAPIAAPEGPEQTHHYLWRFWQRLPRSSKMTIFDRSWYGRVLVERVEGFATDAEWRRAYGEIRSFEQQLLEHGIVLAKFWLHIDQDEQLRRFEAREDTPYKKYKITTEDYRNRSRWDDYASAVDEMVAQTSTLAAPWSLVAANDKRLARIQVLTTVCDRLEAAVTRRL